ncbi:glycoside hydrolase family 35 protein [Paenibacillus methanolicus]|uniref:Beta-galactosidase n=1 Tax=Paenibacillus methanolicus TaxID=582686 RepID=A0A5S5C936_9BACL|nr:beta-galactosidase family protein [Paenibacillus methanolicus]TYP74896.1 beta-galactosidase [Paenibacillus methanolicus]
MGQFGVEGQSFVLNGEPIRLLSGAVHYFRIVPEYWEDRLLKLKACGFNTVETYVPWNLHEPKKGQFNFDGIANLPAFIRLAGDLGLHVIVRPSPYICAEWEFGGLPAWLLADPGMKLRCMHEPYLKHVDDYYDALLPLLKPLLITQGGPVIAVQIENEYGSYGNDKAYLNYLRDGLIARGIDVLLFTSDGPEHHMLQGGMVEGVLETANFGSQAARSFEMLRRYQPDGPLMCMEYWNGWFDHWGEPHHTRDAEDAAAHFRDMMELGASVNFYMFHGGTNFGFMSGANCPSREEYQPTITSYDYDSPLSETGEPTTKFYAVRDVIAQFEELPELKLPEPIPAKAYGTIAATASAGLFDQMTRLSPPIRTAAPETMEALGQNDGFIVYETFVSGPRDEQELVIQDCHDRALVFADDRLLGVIERADKSKTIRYAVPEGGARLRIVVENMGRINYGPYMLDRKGITEGVRIGNAFLFGWTTYCLPLDNLEALDFANAEPAYPQPTFHRAALNVEGKPCDTFLEMNGWTKGVVYCNGFNLGRYWEAGPQRTLYIPAPLLREGENEFIVFELHGTEKAELSFVDRPNLG